MRAPGTTHASPTGMEAAVTARRDAPSSEPDRLYGLGGALLVTSAILFLLKSVLEEIAGPPPAHGQDILSWATTNKLALAAANEAYFFAALFLVPAVIALHRSLADDHPTTAVTGCGMIAVLIPVMLVLDVVQGRLVYPVHGIQIRDPWTAELAVATYYGGLHAVDLVFGAAAVVVSMAMWRGPYGSAIASLGIATGVMAFVAAYAWLLVPGVMLLAQAVATAWLVAVGAKLRGYRRVPSNVAAPSGPVTPA